jgi:hypothetical protein
MSKKDEVGNRYTYVEISEWLGISKYNNWAQIEMSKDG